MVYADGVNTLGGRVHTVRETAELLIKTCKESGVEVNAHKLSTRPCVEIRMHHEVRFEDSYLFLTNSGEYHMFGKNLTKNL